GATQRLLLTRLEWLPPRRLAHRVHVTSGGNPFYALEIASALLRHGGHLDDSGKLPVPESLDALIGADIAQLPDGARRALLATALLTDPRSELVLRATGEEGGAAVEDAIRAGMLVREGSRLRLAHPLYGSVAEARAPLQERREAHLRLAGLVSGAEERARHLALGSVAPEARVAAELEAAALAATARGAASVAAELATAAWRFTDPSDRATRTRRLLDAAERHSRAGSIGQPEEMLREDLPDLPPGPERARALVLLAMRHQPPEVLTLLDEALVCADRPTRAAILAEKAFLSAAGQVDHIEQAHAWAVEAVELAEDENRELQAVCATTLGWMEMMRGRPIAGVTLSLPDPPVAVYDHPDRLHAVRAIWRGETERAGELLHALLAEAERREEEISRVVMTGHLIELALRIGDFRRAAELVDAMRLWALPLRDTPAAERRFRAFLAAAAGDRETLQGELDALTALGAQAPRWQVIEARRACGFADLLAGEAGAAAATLTAVAETVAESGIGDPGAFPVAVDLIEARIAAGDPAVAGALLAELEDCCRAQDHPWGLAGVARGRGLLLAATGDDAGAETALEQAMVRYDQLGLALDAARTQLDLGALLRRRRRRAEARRLLEAAATAGERLGCRPLTHRSQEELSRLGGRRAAGGLTATEARVAALVADGMSNAEIAGVLVVTTRSVEAHLTRIYAKLGIRSRTQLARRMLTSPGERR
ncbi:MAG TPA: helix-turn-helix transcriptional regulator, partial [Solirubrobacteraceae bacterium]|nr:helix-turn-helix transcriptional regulator [Solirubrobacteraceae bacterium]